ncbi:MAG: GDP-mannose 4,6-dehydratase [Verrucomicrobiae bacterium]|nr:GDP-mannose 4,6-dehydratase [Verrucomicrobiae bacterium]
MGKKALITGITGQDGSYLTEFLLAKGYEVHGIVRRTAAPYRGHLPQTLATTSPGQFSLHHGDLADAGSLTRLLEKIRPDEVYNLGAQSDVRISFDIPGYTADVTATGVARMLEAIHQLGLPARFYQASSSEMFGQVRETPQTELTPFHPRSPYAVAKVYAYWIAVNYRESYGLHSSNGILFNHESPRRGENFVTRKITTAVARIQAGRQKKLYMGNIDAQRDWGYAKEYVEAMWLMLQQPHGDDYVIATGETHSVREFLEVAFKHAGLNWQDHVEIDPQFYRPAEVERLIGNAAKAQKQLHWSPKTKFADLVKLMVQADIEALAAAGK